MRFKAILNNPVGLKKLSQTMEKLGSVCVMSLQPDAVRFIVHGGGFTDGIQSWVKLIPQSLFSNYRIESQYNNEISLAISITDLVVITKILAEAQDITMNLKRRGNEPFISFKYDVNTSIGSTISMSNELKVAVVKPDKISLIREPTVLFTPDAFILLPSVAALRPMVERFKAVSKYMVLSASMDGKFKIRIDSTSAICESLYENLVNPDLEGHMPTREPGEYASIRILSEDFVHFLNCYYLEPNDVICSISHEMQLAFYVYLTIDMYQNDDAPIRPLVASQTLLTCHLPVYSD